MREYRALVETHLKHLVLFTCKHHAENLINMTENNHVSAEMLGSASPVCLPPFLPMPARLSTLQESATNRTSECAVSLPLSLLALYVSFPVVFYLENYYFGKGWGLSHGHALAHVFCNWKPESKFLHSCERQLFPSCNAFSPHSPTPAKRFY